MSDSPFNCRDERLKALYAYWKSLPAISGLPRWSSVDPLDIPGLLSCLIISEMRDGGKRIYFRLVGTDMVNWWGRDFTGKFLDEFTEVDYRDYIHGLFLDVVESRNPLYVRSGFKWDERYNIVSERLLLPLSDDGAQVDMVLAGQTYEKRETDVGVAEQLVGTHTEEARIGGRSVD